MSPLDATGQFRHNHESASMHSAVAGKKYMEEGKDQGHEDSGDHVEIHSNGDGTFKTKHGAEEMEHETHGHALIHAAKAHAEEGHKHFMAHHDGEQMHSHSVHAGEEPESRDHEDEQGAKDHMDESMGDGDPEADDKEEQPEHAGAGLGGLY